MQTIEVVMDNGKQMVIPAQAIDGVVFGDPESPESPYGGRILLRSGQWIELAVKGYEHPNVGGDQSVHVAVWLEECDEFKRSDDPPEE